MSEPRAQGRIGIVGGGVAGLVAGYELSKAGLAVTILERSPRLGGLASSFVTESGQEIERYYHFICKPDRPYLEMIRELGLGPRLRWVVTEMGLFHGGQVHPIGDPASLLRLPILSSGDKARMVWSATMAKFGNSTRWRALEDVPAETWLRESYGSRTYKVLYEPLLTLKFHEYAPKISAAWMWARFHRLGNSRTITQKEHLAYLQNGTQAYIDALESALRERAAELRTSTAVDRVVVQEGRVSGVQCGSEMLPFDRVLCTVPIPHLLRLLPDAEGAYFDNLRRIEYLDVLAVVLKLSHRFSPYFWLNVSDPEINLAGVIEYTNLNPLFRPRDGALLYLPQYLPAGHSLQSMSDERVFDLHCNYLQRINPSFQPNWVEDYWVHRSRFAQPVCDLGFSRGIPSIQTPIEGLYVTDSYQLHPDDRTVSGSTDLAEKAARLILTRMESR